MSEPASFFLRVSIEKAQLSRFLQAAPSQPAISANWTHWWNSRDMVGDNALADSLRAWDDASNQAIVDWWIASDETLSFSEYDEAKQVWEFGIIMCSENYGEILPLLVFCESLAPYRNAAATDDFLVIYPFFWGDENVMAYGRYDRDGLVLAPDITSTEQVPQAQLDHASTRMGQKFDEFGEKYGGD